MVKNCLILIVAIIFATNVMAQNSFKIFNTSNSGIAGNEINSIEIDSKGNYWIGTNNGISMYDGQNWISYNTSNSGLVSNNIKSVSIDKYDIKWIGTSNGLSKFDNSKWTTFDSNNSGLQKNWITKVTCDSSNIKWIGTSDGLYKFDDKNWTLFNSSNSNLTENMIWTISVDKNNIKWIGTNNKLNRFDDINWKSYNLSHGVRAISFENPNKLWIGTMGVGLFKLENEAWFKYSNSVGDSINDFWSISIETKGTKWLATSGGLFKFENGIISRVNNSDNTVWDVRTINIDNKNKKLIGTFSNGLIILDDVVPCITPNAFIAAQSSTTFCQGSSVSLNANTGTNYSYQWYNNNQIINGATSSSYQATTSGNYTVKVIDGACNTLSSVTNVIVNSNPIVSLNSLNPLVLKTSSPIQLVGNPTGGVYSGNGVLNSILYPSNANLGNSSITYNYTSPQGCSGSAIRYTIIVDSVGNVCKTTINDTVSILKIQFKLTTGINTNQYTSMKVYPNPTSDLLIIDASDIQALIGYRYRILDLQGKEIYNAFVTTAKTEVSLKSLGVKGVYVLHIIDANNASIQTKQIVLE
jgi:hypothetical protein